MIGGCVSEGMVRAASHTAEKVTQLGLYLLSTYSNPSSAPGMSPPQVTSAIVERVVDAFDSLR